MRAALIAAATLMLIAPNATAQIAAPAPMPAAADASIAPGDQPAGAFALDPRHASVVWRVRHLGVGLFTARFDTLSGTLTFDPAAPERSSVSVAIAAQSVSTGVRNSEGALAFDGEVAEALGAAAHPEIAFVSRAIQVTGAGRGLVQGDLTLNGVTRPVVLDVTFHGGRFVTLRQKHILGFAARTLINRRDFGVDRWAPFVGDEVEILIDAEFVKA